MHPLTASSVRTSAALLPISADCHLTRSMSSSPDKATMDTLLVDEKSSTCETDALQMLREIHRWAARLQLP